MASARTFAYKLVDTLPKYILRIPEDGTYVYEKISVAPSSSSDLPFPTSAPGLGTPIGLLVRSNADAVLSIGDMEINLRGYTGVVTGDASGLFFAQTLYELTPNVITNPSVTDSIEVEYLAYVMPYLDEASAYRIGRRAIGRA